MTQQTTDTEKKILEAAKKVFEFSGFFGARMQQIADEAGISKAALHYYFRTKENLFERIFNETMDEFMVIVSTWDNAGEKWEIKLRRFVGEFFSFLETNSLLFILREINRNPELLITKKKRAKTGFITYFENLKKEGGVSSKVNVPLMYVFLHSLCSYPLLNRNLFKMMTKMNGADFENFMKEYPGHVADLLVNLIKNK